MSTTDIPTSPDVPDEHEIPETHLARRESEGRMRVFSGDPEGTESWIEGAWADPTNLKL